MLWTGQGPDAPGIIATPGGLVQLEVPAATDLELTPSGVLVVARGPGEPFRRFAGTPNWCTDRTLHFSSRPQRKATQLTLVQGTDLLSARGGGLR